MATSPDDVTEFVGDADVREFVGDVIKETPDDVVQETDFYSFTMYYLLKSLLVYLLFFVVQGFRLRNEVFLASPTQSPDRVHAANLPRTQRLEPSHRSLTPSPPPGNPD